MISHPESTSSTRWISQRPGLLKSGCRNQGHSREAFSPKCNREEIPSDAHVVDLGNTLPRTPALDVGEGMHSDLQVRTV